MDKPEKNAALDAGGGASAQPLGKPGRAFFGTPISGRRNALSTVKTVLNTMGSLLLIEGVLLLIPLILVAIYREQGTARAFLFSSLACFGVGLALRAVFKRGIIFYRQSLLVCGSAWIFLSVFACLPFLFTTEKGFVDCYFETVSGFTTTGITIFTNIPVMAKSVLFWRSLIQWLGGLGILTLFLAVTFRSNGAYYQLFSAESHKIDSSRPTPSIYKTVLILWSLYGAFTVLEFIILTGLGMKAFDAVCHSLTTLSTGGFSPYDESIDYFRRAGYTHYRAIEYTITFFMLLGGINFLLHFKIITGQFKEGFRDTELRFFFFLIAVGTALILVDHYHNTPEPASHEANFRHSIFTVVSIITTTGFGTVDINDVFFPAMARQILLIFMLFGGCVGSTAGGFLGAGLTHLNSWQAFSGMFSAVGNIGPCYFSVQEMSGLPVTVKLSYIFGMLAGRLEILPVLVLFSRRAWRS